MPRVRLVSQGVAFMGEAGSPTSSACFASCHVTASGRWLVALRVAPRKTDTRPERILITWSDDEGSSWAPPAAPFSAPVHNDRQGTFRLANLGDLGNGVVGASLLWVDDSNPALPFFNETTEGLLLCRPFLAISRDDGASWEGPRYLDPAPFSMPTPITGPVLVNRAGEWLLQFETQKPYDDAAPWIQSAVMMRSTDGGRTWPACTRVAHDPSGRLFHWDMRARVLPDGRILATFWMFDRESAAYRNIHIAESRDGGHTWSPPWDSGLPGQPAAITQLNGGELALVHVDRESLPCIKMRLSSDGGRSWPEESEFVIARAEITQQGAKGSMQDAWTEMQSFSLGLPQTSPLPDGDLLVTWYQGQTTDHTAIHWARLRRHQARG